MAYEDNPTDPFRHDGRLWSCKLGTMPHGMVRLRHRYWLSVGAYVKYREEEPGAKWKIGKVTCCRPSDSFLAMDPIANASRPTAR